MPKWETLGSAAQRKNPTEADATRLLNNGTYFKDEFFFTEGDTRGACPFSIRKKFWDEMIEKPDHGGNKNLSDKKLNYINTKIENIRVIQGTNFNYFSDEGKKIFFEKEFVISKLSDRMGMRLEGPKIENIVDTNIKSEGLLKGVIQVPADGNPIIMLSDHGTIGGYPKIGVVISADYDKLVQLTPGSKIKFKKVELADAETLFKLYDLETQNLISQI